MSDATELTPAEYNAALKALFQATNISAVAAEARRRHGRFCGVPFAWFEMVERLCAEHGVRAWDAMGVSRSTWSRRRSAAKKASPDE